MKNIITTISTKTMSAITILASSMLFISVTQAELLLEVDLSVENTITITSTEGLSDATVSGSDFTGFYLSDMFDVGSDAGSSFLGRSLVSGDLAGSLDVSDNSPDLFRAGSGTDTGLNIWSYASGELSFFEAGQRAFSGGATWTVDPVAYLQALNAVGGDIFFAASSLTSSANASILGTWAVVGGDETPVSAPTTIGFTILAMLLTLLRRSNKKVTQIA